MRSPIVYDREVRGLAVVVALLSTACGFDKSASLSPGGGPGGGMPDADIPPVSGDVQVVGVTSSVAALRPGLYGIEVAVVVRNGSEADIDAIEATLTFTAGTDNRAGLFHWRDADARDGVTDPQPSSIIAGGQQTFRFRVDAMPWAVGDQGIVINGLVTFDSAGSRLTAQPWSESPAIGFEYINAPIVVDLVDDTVQDDGQTSLREALIVAAASPGVDRIVFDSAVFAPGDGTVIQLDESLDELPAITANGGGLVIDGSGADVTLAVDSNWTDPEGRYGLQLDGGRLAVYGIGFRDMGYNYRDEGDLSGNNCGASGAQLEGGAIRVDGGTLVVQDSHFADPNVDERNCYAASIRIHGGSGHRILGSRWTEQSMDAIYLNAAAVEITDNVFDAESSLAKVDECIYIDGQGGQDLWVIGNLCVDQEYSGVVAGGGDAGTLYLAHNTFVRTGRSGLGAIRRNGTSREIVGRNNLYVDNNPAAYDDNDNGNGMDIAFDAVTGSPFCDSGCASAVRNTPSLLELDDLDLVNSSGTTMSELRPNATSPIVNSGVDWIDRNGTSPGRFNGPGCERGAVELGP